MTVPAPALTQSDSITGSARPFWSSIVVLLAVSLIPAALSWFIVAPVSPDQISFSMWGWGHPVVLKNVHHKIHSDFILTMSLAAGVFLAELCAVGWRESSLRKVLVRPKKSALSDISVFLAGQVPMIYYLSILMTGGLIFFSASWLRTEFVKYTGITVGLYELPLLIQVATCYLIYTFLDYWAHRLAHLSCFWPLHRFHHAAEDFCIFTSVRVHPADLTGLFIVTVPLFLLGPSNETVLALSYIIPQVRLFIHSRIDSELGLVGRTVLQAPVHHRLHHARDISSGPVVNFSLCPLWDRMFGTWKSVESAEFAIGVDHPYRHGAWFLPDLWRDYCDYLGELKRLGFQMLAPASERPAPRTPKPAKTRIGGDDLVPAMSGEH